MSNQSIVRLIHWAVSSNCLAVALQWWWNPLRDVTVISLQLFQVTYSVFPGLCNSCCDSAERWRPSMDSDSVELLTSTRCSNLRWLFRPPKSPVGISTNESYWNLLGREISLFAAGKQLDFNYRRSLAEMNPTANCPMARRTKFRLRKPRCYETNRHKLIAARHYRTTTSAGICCCNRYRRFAMSMELFAMLQLEVLNWCRDISLRPSCRRSIFCCSSNTSRHSCRIAAAQLCSFVAAGCCFGAVRNSAASFASHFVLNCFPMSHRSYQLRRTPNSNRPSTSGRVGDCWWLACMAASNGPTSRRRWWVGNLSPARSETCGSSNPQIDPSAVRSTDGSLAEGWVSARVSRFVETLEPGRRDRSKMDFGCCRTSF